MMILCGWSATLLLAANSALGEQLAHALAEGQLYFAGAGELTATLLLVIVVLWTLPRLMPHLLRSRFFRTTNTPTRYPRGNGISVLTC